MNHNDFLLHPIRGLRPLDMLSVRSSSIYCRLATIRYKIDPSFAKQTYRVCQHISNAAGIYRKSRKGFISLRDVLSGEITKYLPNTR